MASGRRAPLAGIVMCISLVLLDLASRAKPSQDTMRSCQQARDASRAGDRHGGDDSRRGVPRRGAHRQEAWRSLLVWSLRPEPPQGAGGDGDCMRGGMYGEAREQEDRRGGRGEAERLRVVAEEACLRTLRSREPGGPRGAPWPRGEPPSASIADLSYRSVSSHLPFPRDPLGKCFDGFHTHLWHRASREAGCRNSSPLPSPRMG